MKRVFLSLVTIIALFAAAHNAFSQEIFSPNEGPSLHKYPFQLYEIAVGLVTCFYF